MRLGGGRKRVAFEGVERGVPTERGALDARGERMNAGERGEVADLGGRFAGGDDVVELVVKFLGLGGGLALELRRHERGAGLRDGATGTIESDLRDAVAIEPQMHAAFVAAGRVVAVGDAVGRGEFATVAGAAVVVENDLLIKFGEIGGHGGRRETRWWLGEIGNCGVRLARAGKTVKVRAMSLLIRHARVLTLAQPAAAAVTTLLGGRKARRGPALKELGVIARGDVLVVDGKIAAVGPELSVPADAEVIEADGRVLMPGFVDCHTHACWAGDRLAEWEQELSGVAPAEILKKGGGIQATVRAVREATRKQLAASLRVRLDAMLRGGTTTMEVKSGYGLSIDGETKMLHAIARAAQEFTGTVVPTALLGQAVEGDVAAFTRMVVRELLPAVWHEFPGIAVDAVSAPDAWPVEACVRLFERAGKHGLPLRVSADAATSTGMVPEALRLHLRSVDHLENASKADLVALAASDTFGVFTPAASFHGKGRYARAGAFADSGGLLALASDYGVASAPTHSMPFVIALAVRYAGLTPAEAITATTVNAAAVLGLTDRGTIEVGQRADLILLRHRDERLLAHEIGGNPVELVVAGGARVV